MSSTPRIDILGTGVYLPPTIRTNDYWSQDIVDSWTQRTFLKKDKDAARAAKAPVDEAARSPGWKLALEANQAWRDDPFMGTRERRILEDSVESTDIEALAAKEALADSGVALNQIDAVITQAATPDYLCNADACSVHQKLGLKKSCLSISNDASMCSGFVHQLTLAEGLIASGRAKYVLLCQSQVIARIVEREAQHSSWFGDGAAAVVVGPATGNNGVLGLAHQTYGQFIGSVYTGVKNKKWYQGGDMLSLVGDRGRAREMLLSSVDWAKEVFDDALAQSGLARDDIRFYAAHQMPAWFRAVTQGHLGLEHARHNDTYPWAGTIAGANLPLALHLARKERLLQKGDGYAFVAAGAGATVAAVVARLGA